MSELVGAIHYDCTLETQGLINARRKVDAELKKAGEDFDHFGQRGAMAMTAIASAVKVLTVALGLLKVAELAEDMRQLETRVKVAAGNVDAGAVAFERLREISQQTQTSLAGNVEVFARLNQSLLQMGGTQEDTLRITELLGKAIKVSGASAGEAKAAMLQFGQALGSGKLAGDELKSLMETAPYLMRQLAAAIGVPVGQLKSLGEQGKLTASVVANALTKAKDEIDADFASFADSIGDALQAVRDQAGMASMKLDDLTGGTAAMAGAGQGLAAVLERLAAQFGAANEKAGALGRDETVKAWAKATKTALSYVVDAADVTVQALTVLGRNVGFVFTGIKEEVTGIGRQIAAVARGDFSAAAAIGDAMTKDAEKRRAELDAADAKTLAKRKLFGEQMREAWEQGAGGGRGFVNPEAAPSTLKTPTDPEEARKAASKATAARAYLEGLVAANKTALERIDAEEQKALTENQRRMLEDKENAGIYTRAKVEIVKKFARERALFEEQSAQEVADLQIELTTDAAARIEAVRLESVRRAQEAERLGTMTHEQAERAKVAATFRAEQERADLAERNARARADAAILLAGSSEQRILLTRDEAVRQAEEAYRRGQASFEEAEAAKVSALQTAIEQQKQLEATRTNVRLGTLQIQAEGGDPQKKEELIREQAAAEMAAVEQARLLDLEASQLYADQKVAIEQRMQQDIANLRSSAAQSQLAGASDLFGSLATIAAAGAGKQSGIYKAMFAASKAFAIADSIVKIQQGIANAAALPFPANIPAMAGVAAATASIITTIQGTNYGGGRRYGGPVSAGTLYQVNESGQPEMFTAANGSQYMLPTSGGRVTSAADLAGASAPPLNVVIVNNGRPMQEESRSWDANSRTVTLAVQEVAGQIAERRGAVWGALRSTNVQGRPG